MTREEAKRAMKYLYVCSENHVTIAINSRDRQALNMAIKALEEPEPCEGAVSRVDVEIEIANLLKGVFVEYEDIAKKVTARLSSVTPKQKKGKWLPDNNSYYEERFICSVCGRSYKVDTCMGKPMWDFCPCGADMRGEWDE